MNFFRELFCFLIKRKKLWLMPIIIATLLLGALLVLAPHAVMAPFVYTLF